jgi:hypothetical protein
MCYVDRPLVLSSMRIACIPAFLVVASCDQSSAPSAKPDPWASNASAAPSPAADPWSSGAAAPSAPAPSTPAPSGVASDLDNRYACSFVGSTLVNGLTQVQFRPMSIGFTIDHGTYTSGSDRGTIEYDGSYVTFHGGEGKAFDGWRGAVNTHQDGTRYVVFHGDDHRSGKPGDGARFGDISCELTH